MRCFGWLAGWLAWLLTTLLPPHWVYYFTPCFRSRPALHDSTVFSVLAVGAKIDWCTFKVLGCSQRYTRTTIYLLRTRILLSSPSASSPNVQKMSAKSSSWTLSRSSSRSSSISSISSASACSMSTTSSQPLLPPQPQQRRPSIQLQGQQISCTDREAQLYFLMGFKTAGAGAIGGLG